MTQDQEKQTQDRQLAEKRQQDGFRAFNEGKLDKAIEAFGDAEIRFRLIGDLKKAGDCRSLIAEAQSQNGEIERAINSYQRASKLYKDASQTALEAGSLLSMGTSNYNAETLNTPPSTIRMHSASITKRTKQLMRPMQAEAWPTFSASRVSSKQQKRPIDAPWRSISKTRTILAK
jgi:tetratricopeptide (TPR) repeat protein